MVLEIVKFRAAAGVDRARIEELSAPVTEWLARQPGFRWRTLAAPTEGSPTWTDLVGWADEASAQAAMAASAECPALAELFPLLDPATVEISHLPVVHEAR